MTDEKQLEALVSTILGIVTACVMTSYVLGMQFMTKVRLYFTEPAALITVGALIGWVVKNLDGGGDLKSSLSFDTSAFFLYLLPPIIFASGYNMKTSSFFANFGTILTFGCVGTLLSTAVVGGLMKLICDHFRDSQHMDPLSLVESSLLGSILSAVDSVATIAIFVQVGVPEELFILTFGESVFNDAASIVSYRTLKEFIINDSVSTQACLQALMQVVWITAGSMTIGVALGCLCALVLKHTYIHHEPPLETAVFWLFPYGSYLIAEQVELSGVMSILFCGISMGHYAYYNLSMENQISTPVNTTIVSTLAEAFVFAYLGISIFTVDGLVTFSVEVLGAVFAACYLGRAAGVFVLGWVVNRVRTKRVTLADQVVIWFSGGMRGAVAFALALDARESDDLDSKVGDLAVPITLFVVLFTLALNGGATFPLLRALKMLEHNENDLKDDGTPSQIVEPTAANWLVRLDAAYLSPFLRNDHRQVTTLNGTASNAEDRSRMQIRQRASDCSPVPGFRHQDSWDNEAVNDIQYCPPLLPVDEEEAKSNKPITSPEAFEEAIYKETQVKNNDIEDNGYDPDTARYRGEIGSS